MRLSNEKWTFFTSKTPLQISEVQYWKNALARIMKVGIEFEFNLPNKKGTCKGNLNTCVCTKANSEYSCWKECVEIENCIHLNMHVCPGVLCADFTSKCSSCTEFDTNCTICEHRYIPESNPNNIRSTLGEELNPSNHYGRINKYGVHSITTDGSLVGGEGKDKGAEIITTGRRLDYWEFYNMCKFIISKACDKGAYVNERCSIHMHLLASYYLSNVDQSIEINELEKPLPQIIIANFHQLCRRYQNAITWMCMGLDDESHLTRWEKFRVSVLDTSAVLNSMTDIKKQILKKAGEVSQIGTGNRYGWINYFHTNFNNTGDVTKLHMEMRTLDAILCPSVVTAIACLYYALVIKAVEISRYGILEIGDSSWMNQTRKIKNVLFNNTAGYGEGDRFSDTSALYKYYDVLTEESNGLIQQLKHILIGMPPAYQILSKIAKKPIALRRCEEDISWENLEKEFYVAPPEEQYFEFVLSRYIDLRLVDQCTDIATWIAEVSKSIKDSEEITKELKEKEISKYIDKKRNDGMVIWSKTLGAIVKV